MAITALNTIKNWFKTGLIPTQVQFWDTWDSFRHKGERIPVADIDGINELLQSKAETEVLEHHLTDSQAHSDLFNSKADKDQFDAHLIDSLAHDDLFYAKEDKSQKGVENGYAPLNDFAKLANEYLDIVNDLITGGTTSILSAEQGKLLQTRIDAINTILTSNNVNLDTVQELVDAIVSVQMSLNTILVNDLTTGGTTKALTAEMGKLLQTNKVEKVAGERLISAAEITKLSALANVTTTVKTILSTALGTQNVAGFVTYINALNPVLVVGANEIVRYTTSDTGRTFELNLRGRSFGVGQPVIVAADVLEITEFLNKDIKLSNYPNTRNDGQLPTNKVLSTDINGNLKMYTIATAPAPYLEVLVPDSTLPSTTTNFVLKGAFFTPAMTVSIVGQTINYITFVSDNQVKVNVTTGAIEGSYAVTLNNGISATFNDALLIVLGTVFKPKLADWLSILNVPDLNTEGEMKLANISLNSGATWNKSIDKTKRFRILFSITESPLVLRNSTTQVFDPMFRMTDSVSGDTYEIRVWLEDSSSRAKFYWYKNGVQVGVNRYTQRGNFRIDYDGAYLYINQDTTNENAMSVIDTVTLAHNWNLTFWVKRFDVKNIKYIELA